MPFEKFRLLPEDTKIQKLIIAYEKIALRAARDNGSLNAVAIMILSKKSMMPF